MNGRRGSVEILIHSEFLLKRCLEPLCNTSRRSSRAGCGYRSQVLAAREFTPRYEPEPDRDPGASGSPVRKGLVAALTLERTQKTARDPGSMNVGWNH